MERLCIICGKRYSQTTAIDVDVYCSLECEKEDYKREFLERGKDAAIRPPTRG